MTNFDDFAIVLLILGCGFGIGCCCVALICCCSNCYKNSIEPVVIIPTSQSSNPMFQNKHLSSGVNVIISEDPLAP